MVVSWARTILSISKKAWTFPSRPYYYILSFPKINRKPNNNKTVGRKGHTGPRDSLEGESCLAGSFLIPAAPEGTYWAPGAAPCEEELPCRFLSRPGSSGRDILGPQGSPMWGRAALQVPLLSHDLVTDWVHPSGSQQHNFQMIFQNSIRLVTLWIVPCVSLHICPKEISFMSTVH